MTVDHLLPSYYPTYAIHVIKSRSMTRSALLTNDVSEMAGAVVPNTRQPFFNVFSICKHLGKEFPFSQPNGTRSLCGFCNFHAPLMPIR